MCEILERLETVTNIKWGVVGVPQKDERICGHEDLFRACPLPTVIVIILIQLMIPSMRVEQKNWKVHAHRKSIDITYRKY